MKKEKINLKVVISIVTVVTIILILIFMKNISKNNNASERPGNQEQTESKIDYGNTENVEIQENVKINISKKAKEEKIFEGLKIKEFKANSENDMTNISIQIENISGEIQEERYLKIVCINQAGESIGEVYVCVPKLEAGETTNSQYTLPEDYTNLYNYTISKYIPEEPKEE